MNFKNTSVPAILFISLFICISCEEWTEKESLQIENKKIDKVNPELYRAYLENLRLYKKSDHQKMIVSFDNSQKKPVSKAHHINTIPDSVDIVSLQSPNLKEWEYKELMETRNKKGTKFITTLSFEKIKAQYDELVKEHDKIINNLKKGEKEPAKLPDFSTFMVQYLHESIALVEKFNYDGLCFSYIGKGILHMTENEKQIYMRLQNAFVGILKDWAGRNKDKLFLFQGKPQNLLTNDFLNLCKYIIIPCTEVTSALEIVYNINSALVKGVPTDRFVVAVDNVSLDKADTKTGYWGKDINAVLETSKWCADTKKNNKVNGMMSNNVERDYYNKDRIYSITRTAIKNLNPSINH